MMLQNLYKKIIFLFVFVLFFTLFPFSDVNARSCTYLQSSNSAESCGTGSISAPNNKYFSSITVNYDIEAYGTSNNDAEGYMTACLGNSDGSGTECQTLMWDIPLKNTKFYRSISLSGSPNDPDVWTQAFTVIFAGGPSQTVNYDLSGSIDCYVNCGNPADAPISCSSSGSIEKNQVDTWRATGGDGPGTYVWNYDGNFVKSSENADSITGSYSSPIGWTNMTVSSGGLTTSCRFYVNTIGGFGAGGGGGPSGPECGNDYIEGGEDCDGGPGCTSSCTWITSTCVLPHEVTFGLPLATYKEYLYDNICYASNRPVDPTCLTELPTANTTGKWRAFSGDTSANTGSVNSCNASNTGGGYQGALRGLNGFNIENGNQAYWTEQWCARRFQCDAHTQSSTPPPSFTLYCDGSCTILNNTSVNISWTPVLNAISCSASGAWAGNKSVNGGTQSTGNLVVSKTYTLNCTGPGGSTSDSVLVTVLPMGSSIYDLNLVSKVPSSSGTITSFPEGINCGVGCASASAEFLEDSMVTLFAIPSSSYWKFNGWAGDCSSSGANTKCVLNINSDKFVSAQFVPRIFNYREF